MRAVRALSYECKGDKSKCNNSRNVSLLIVIKKVYRSGIKDSESNHR